jgi:hypothetical protein
MKNRFVSEWQAIYESNHVPQKGLPALAEAFVNHLR